MRATDGRIRLCVLTGDHAQPDATKHGGGYGAMDLRFDRAMREALATLPGYELEFLNTHERLIDHMREQPPDLVLNLCDTGFRNVATHELHVPALLELLGIPYTGAPPACIALCYDKQAVRLLAEAQGIPTPREEFLAHDDSLDAIDAAFPALVKPNRADGSVGITADAVVESADEARAYVERLRRELPGTDVLVQEYLPGPEYGLALVGNPATGFEDLPPLEVDFSALPDGLAPILGFESKAIEDSPYYTSIRYHAAGLDEATVATLRRRAARLFDRLGLRDYARFDFRAAADATIKLMEVNPNPAWDPEAKLAFMTGFAGRPYADVFTMILTAARRRLGTWGRS